MVGRVDIGIDIWYTHDLVIRKRGVGRMNYIVPLVVAVVFPFMIPFMALVVLVAVLNKARVKPAENYGDIQDD